MVHHTHNHNMLSTKTEQLLNDQIAQEAHASAVYLSMASWCDSQGCSEAAGFLYKHSDEEREHMLKLVHHVNDVGGHAISPLVMDVPVRFASLRAVFEQAMEQERRVTKSIQNIMEHCLSEKDFTTFVFMQWFVEEQKEEEIWAQKALELFDTIGEEGIGLYTINKAIGKLGKK